MRLAYLYVGSADVGADLELWRDRLGGDLLWDISSGGTRVAALRFDPEGPSVLLADHRPAGSVIQIWSVTSLRDEERRMRHAGWDGEGHRVEIPDGPVLILADLSGNQVGLLEQTRPGILER